jgi:large subunit ribosomal protein L6
MSRIGKTPIEIPSDVSINISGNTVEAKGSKGNLTIDVHRALTVKEIDGFIILDRKGETKIAKSLHGTYRALITSMIQGVDKGWEKKLEIVGAGYKAQLEGKDLVLVVGYSHPVKIEAPDGITFKVEKNVIAIEGIDKQLVGQTAAKVRDVRPPEPYQGKGIMYVGEEIRRKAGKAAKADAA